MKRAEPKTIEEYAARLVEARQQFRVQRDEIVRLGRENGVLMSEKAEAGRRMGKLIAEKGLLEDVIGVAAKIIDGDALPDTLPDHPLIRTADDVAKFAADRVRWHKLAQYRWGLLDELITMMDGRSDLRKLSGESEWVRLVGRIRTELLERIDE